MDSPILSWNLAVSIISVASGLILVGLALIVSLRATLSTEKRAEIERRRLAADLSIRGVNYTFSRESTDDFLPSSDQTGDKKVTSKEPDPHLTLLLDYYSQSLAQFKASFRISLLFASLGAFILLAGVGFALLRANTDGQQYAAIISTVGGTVISLLSGVLFAYSNRAIRHLDDQTMRLREDFNAERDFERRRGLLESINDTHIRDHVIFCLIVGSSDPSPRLMQLTDPVDGVSTNGVVDTPSLAPSDVQ